MHSGVGAGARCEHLSTGRESGKDGNVGRSRTVRVEGRQWGRQKKIKRQRKKRKGEKKKKGKKEKGKKKVRKGEEERKKKKEKKNPWFEILIE